MSSFRKSILALVAWTFICLALFSEEPADKVNPFIGTTNYGTTNPGPVLPNGMMSVSPFNVMGSDLNRFDKDKQWWSTPYTNINKFFTGFSHVNLSGVGCRSEEHTSELQSRPHLVCRLLLEKKKIKTTQL